LFSYSGLKSGEIALDQDDPMIIIMDHHSPNPQQNKAIGSLRRLPL
jgi:hypothetical protein